MYEREAGDIRRMMRNGPRMVFSDHARERMAQRGITEADVRAVLSRCLVTEVRPGVRGDVLSAEGRDLDDRRLRVCVALNPPKTIIVVTAIDL